MRTQQVIAHESGAADTVDPFAGSYFVEALTDELEAHAYEYFQKIDAIGGMVERRKRDIATGQHRRDVGHMHQRDPVPRGDERCAQRDQRIDVPGGRRRRTARAASPSLRRRPR